MKRIQMNLETILGLTGYLFIGTAAVLIPSIMPSITEEFTVAGLTLTAIGLIFPARAIGGMIGNLSAGIGSDLLGRERLVWLSALLLAIALALAAFTAQWWLFLVGFAVLSGAQGALSTGINAMIADANRSARAQALNILHGVYGVGAALSPLVIGYLLEVGIPWRWALGGTGAIWLLYSVVTYSANRTANRPGQPAKATAAKEATEWNLLRSGAFTALFFIAFAYNGVAWSLLGWVAIFMQRSANFSTFLSLSMISVFYIALTVGRFLCAAYAEPLGYARTLLLLAIGITVTYPLVVFSTQPLLVVIGIFCTGLSLSGLFPTALAYGSRLFPEQTGTVTGILSIA
ncbi:MAG: MFS transporter, partial [Caldilineaceae bacterium]|nr:MFS transporter [Caldilineaceae bacterium]